VNLQLNSEDSVKTNYKVAIALIAGTAIGGAAIPAFAQSDITLSKGQVLRVSPDGKISVAAANMDPKMQSAMNKQAKKVTKGLVVWLDENGKMSFIENPIWPAPGSVDTRLS